MLNRLKTPTALKSAVFVSVSLLVIAADAFSQAPIIDASIDNSQPQQQPIEAPAPVSTEPASANIGMQQGELFYQLQLLQQEVMQLRGVVEEQAYQLKQLKDQSKERYIDLDRRIGELATAPAAATSTAPVVTANRPATGRPSAPVVAEPNEKSAYDKAYSMVVNRRFDEALEAFKQFLIDYPDGKYTPNSYYWMGELYGVTTPPDHESARQVFTQLLDQYPDHAKTPDAMFKLGKVYFLKGNRSKSRELLDKVIAEYSQGSNSSAANKARQFINANF